MTLSPEARQAVQSFWRAAQNKEPIRHLFLDAREMVEEELFNDQLPKGDDLMRCNCGHEGPAADFTNDKGKLTKMCGPCRAEWGAKRRRKNKTAVAPLPIAIQTPAEVAPSQAPVPATEMVTLTLTPTQAEKLVELTLRRIIERDPARLTKALPTLVDLLD